MNKQVFKIHGDNIVECERMLNFILPKLDIQRIKKEFISKAAIKVDLKFIYLSKTHNWEIILHPGFNKSGRKRWDVNIFDALKDAGSFIDEAPDAIITRVEGEKEVILCAIEFCSALQAGNQAWQRSGRAYSTMRTGCPYLYIVDFVKYELNTKTRERKSIRTPNAAIPYSYISHSRNENVFGVQAFIKSEEFDKQNPMLIDFDETVFSEDDIAVYLINLLLGLDTTQQERILIKKNLKMVDFFAEKSSGKYIFKPEDWNRMYNDNLKVLDVSKEKKWEFTKKIAKKSDTGNIGKVVELSKKYAYGITSKDLPFGIIPEDRKQDFFEELLKIYNIPFPEKQNILMNNEDLIICIVKGFKPRGDDNRPDRGILPLLAMLASEESCILTFIYGPMTESRVRQLENDPGVVAKKNGFWNVFLGLSNYLLLDVPIINQDKNMILFRENNIYKQDCIKQSPKDIIITNSISPHPNSVHEDDVDSIIHFLFTNLSSDISFEGLCNPPGGDWSGLSIIHDNVEYRWVSLPRVSGKINGKRPDHVIQLFPPNLDSIVLSIESKDKAADLEKDIGIQLKQYIRYLSGFIPSCERSLGGEWEISRSLSSFDPSVIVSVVAFIGIGNEDYEKIRDKAKCDLIFSLELEPSGSNYWHLKIINCLDNTKIIDYLEDILTLDKSIGIHISFIK